MNEIENTKAYALELTRIYNHLNEEFFGGELPEVIITFTGTKGAHGHMTTAPVWVADETSGKYEMNISAYTINRSPDEICETILHEQCHLYDNIHGIEDCSNGGRYHNKKFKETAESHGLTVSQSGYHGWAHTELNDDARRYVKGLRVKQFKFKRQYMPKGGNLKRFACPNGCPVSVFASTPQNVVCGECGAALVYKPTKDSI